MSIPKEKIFITIILIVLLGFSVYANSLRGQFIWDDGDLVENNTLIRNWSNLPQIFTKDIAVGTEKESRHYRPLQMLTYMMDYSFWDLNVLGYHLSNIFWHVLASLALVWLISILFEDWPLSLLTGLLFVVHPVHTEVVTYIAGRADSLALLFVLLSFIFYIKDSRNKHWATFFLLVIFYILALFSRENSLILPVLILLYRYYFAQKIEKKSFSIVIGVSVCYILLRAFIFKASISSAYPETTMLQRIPGFFAAITTYIRLFFFPFNLHMEYGHKLFQFNELKVILGMVIFIAALTYATKKRREDKLVSFSIVWFFVTLLPVSNLYPINAYMAEHWLYLPSIGFFLIFAQILCRWKGQKGLFVFLTVFILGYYSFLTIKQNLYWRHPIKFYERLVKFAPESSRVLNNLGKAYYEEGKSGEAAISYYKRSMELNPDYYGPYFNLGLIYSREGRFNDAIGAYKKAIELKPEFARAYNDLGYVYYRLERYAQAIPLFKKAISLEPNYAEAQLNLGNVYNAMNKKQEALSLYKQAAESNPGYVDAHFNLGVLYAEMNDHNQAIACYQRALKINPNEPQIYYALSVAFLKLEQYELAIQYYEKARGLGFTSPELEALLETHR